jgi:O-antigen ligase
LKQLQTIAGTVARWAVVIMCVSLPTSRTLFSTAGAIVLLCFILEGQWRQKWASFKQNAPALTLTVMVAWFYLTAIWTEANHTQLEYGANIHWKLLLVPVIVLLIQDLRWKTRCWQGFGAGMVLLLAHVYTLGFMSIPWIRNGSPSSVFYNPLYQSVGLAIFSALCVSYFLDTFNRWHKFLVLSLFLAASYAVLIISHQRLGYLTWAAGLLLVLIIKLKPLHRKWGVMLGLGLCIAIFMSSSNIQERFGLGIKEVLAYNFENNYTSMGTRLHMWYASVNSISTAPLLGHGLGSYPMQAKAFFNDLNMCVVGCTHPHNQYLFYGVEFGFVGLGLFLWMFYSALKLHRSLSHDSTMPLVVLLVFAFSGLVDGTLWVRGFLNLFIPLLGLSMLNPTQGDSEHPHKHDPDS